jgi:hypothetical protein
MLFTCKCVLLRPAITTCCKNFSLPGALDKEPLYRSGSGLPLRLPFPAYSSIPVTVRMHSFLIHVNIGGAK